MAMGRIGALSSIMPLGMGLDLPTEGDMRGRGMTSTTNPEDSRRAEETPHDVFVRQVRDALASLHDLPYLRSHPLAGPDSLLSGVNPNERARLLQQHLLEAIEELRPSADGNGNEGRALRRYEMVRLRYVDGLAGRERRT